MTEVQIVGRVDGGVGREVHFVADHPRRVPGVGEDAFDGERLSRGPSGGKADARRGEVGRGIANDHRRVGARDVVGLELLQHRRGGVERQAQVILARGQVGRHGGDHRDVLRHSGGQIDRAHFGHRRIGEDVDQLVLGQIEAVVEAPRGRAAHVAHLAGDRKGLAAKQEDGAGPGGGGEQVRSGQLTAHGADRDVVGLVGLSDGAVGVDHGHRVVVARQDVGDGRVEGEAGARQGRGGDGGRADQRVVRVVDLVPREVHAHQDRGLRRAEVQQGDRDLHHLTRSGGRRRINLHRKISADQEVGAEGGGVVGLDVLGHDVGRVDDPADGVVARRDRRHDEVEGLGGGGLRRQRGEVEGAEQGVAAVDGGVGREVDPHREANAAGHQADVAGGDVD